MVPTDSLALEILRLSNAWAVDGLDVVVPGTRDDLVRRWVRERLTGRGQTEEDWIALAREIAPAPDEHLLPYTDPAGKTRYRSDNKQLDAITAASEEAFGGSPRPSRNMFRGPTAGSDLQSRTESLDGRVTEPSQVPGGGSRATGRRV